MVLGLVSTSFAAGALLLASSSGFGFDESPPAAGSDAAFAFSSPSIFFVAPPPSPTSPWAPPFLFPPSSEMSTVSTFLTPRALGNMTYLVLSATRYPWSALCRKYGTQTPPT